MSTVKITQKEVNFIADLLTQESIACKKARLYAKTITDQDVSSVFESVANNHERRFNALLNIIS